jgi:polysaccharide pyruvyl transferase WcaK-like protein
MREYTLALFGAFGCGNYGNDATLDACLSLADGRVPKSRILCIATDPVRVRGQHGLATHPMAAPGAPGGKPLGRALGILFRGWRELGALLRAYWLLRRVATLVIAGTGVLDDQHLRPTQLPLDVLRWCCAARLAATRLVFLSVGAGPIDQPWSRAFLKRAVRLAHQVTYRDQRSLEYMRALGRDVRSDRVLPDLVFALVPPGRDEPGPRRGRRIALGLLWSGNWLGRRDAHRRYEDRIVELVVRLAKDGWEVCLVTGDDVDVEAEAAILERPEVSGLPIQAGRTHSFAEVVELAAGCRAMIASRYHNVVAAVVVGIPVISLGYGPKNDALLEHLDAGEWGHHIDDFSVDNVVEQVTVAAGRDERLYRPQLERYREALRREFESLTSD